MQSKKIAYIINHLSFFYSHILPHAIVAKKNGFKIKSKQPRGKYVPEPIMGLENAKRWIAMEFLLNA